MEKDVMITIEGLQTVEGEDNSSNELITQGKYRYEKDAIRFSYMESALTGLEGTKTSFHVTPSEVVLRRSGAVTSQMIFHKGQRHNFVYDTPYGALTMRVDTHRIESGLGETGGRIEIEYDIDFEQAVLSRNKFVINVREQRGS